MYNFLNDTKYCIADIDFKNTPSILYCRANFNKHVEILKKKSTKTHFIRDHIKIFIMENQSKQRSPKSILISPRLNRARKFLQMHEYGGCEFPNKEKKVKFNVPPIANEMNEELTMRNMSKECFTGGTQANFMSQKFRSIHGSHNRLDKNLNTERDRYMKANTGSNTSQLVHFKEKRAASISFDTEDSIQSNLTEDSLEEEKLHLNEAFYN